jgi:hypothetical protein
LLRRLPEQPRVFPEHVEMSVAAAGAVVTEPDVVVKSVAVAAARKASEAR